jgi:hypothetical protein
MKNTFAIVCEWPNANAAENETIARMKIAASVIKKNVLVIDKVGNILDDNLNVTPNIIQNKDIDFVINLHFASPKCYDGFSYVALWNPIRFYHDWGYERYSYNLLTHHDFISCLSEPANDHAARISYINNTKHLKPEMVLNHTNCNSYYDPNSERDSIFYCGINWDKSSGKSRFSQMFQILDNKNILKIYGPKKLGKIIPWEGFKSYVDEIPFDGVSTFQEISKCLLGLALSHEAHIESEIASSRVFELIAGGALPICDENRFFKEYFGKKILYVSGNDKEKAKQISNHYNWALQNKDKVKQMVNILQSHMKENFDLSTQLNTLYQKHQKRRELIEKQYCSLERRYQVNIVYIHLVTNKKEYEDDFKKLIISVKNQNYQNMNILIASNSAELSKIVALDELGIKYKVVTHCYNKYNQLGLILNDIKNHIKESENQLFVVTTRYESFFYDHISALVRNFEDKAHCQATESICVLKGKQGFDMISNNQDTYGEVKDHNFVIGSVMFAKLPPDFILKYLNFRNYKQSLKSYFGDSYDRINVLTNNQDIDHNLLYDENCLNISLTRDFAPMSKDCSPQNLVISKDIAYQLLSKVKFFRPFLEIRKIMLNRKTRRRNKVN